MRISKKDKKKNNYNQKELNQMGNSKKKLVKPMPKSR